MIYKQRLASIVLALGLGLTSLPAVGFAAPISSASSTRLDRAASFAPSWSQSPSGDFGSTLLDLFASVADSLSNCQDTVATEAYLGSACDLPC